MEAKFLTSLNITMKDGDENTWIVLHPFAYQSPVLEGIVVVPSGFETDFASVPRLPVVYVLSGNTAHKAAVIHDYLYSSGICTRAAADKVFFEAMGLSKVPFWRKALMYCGVRLFGGGYFKEKQDEIGD